MPALLHTLFTFGESWLLLPWRFSLWASEGKLPSSCPDVKALVTAWAGHWASFTDDSVQNSFVLLASLVMDQTKVSSNPSHSSLLHFTFSLFRAGGCSKRANVKVWGHFRAAIFQMVGKRPAWHSEVNSGHLLGMFTSREVSLSSPTSPTAPHSSNFPLLYFRKKDTSLWCHFKEKNINKGPNKGFWKSLLLKGQQDHLF